MGFPGTCRSPTKLVSRSSFKPVDGSEIWRENHLGCIKNPMNTGISYYINWCRISEPSTVLLLLQVAVGTTTFLGAKKLRLTCFLFEGSPDLVSG